MTGHGSGHRGERLLPVEDLTENERAWVEFIRLISDGRDPGITLERVQGLRRVLRPELFTGAG